MYVIILLLRYSKASALIINGGYLKSAFFINEYIRTQTHIEHKNDSFTSRFCYCRFCFHRNAEKTHLTCFMSVILFHVVFDVDEINIIRGNLSDKAINRRFKHFSWFISVIRLVRLSSYLNVIWL